MVHRQTLKNATYKKEKLNCSKGEEQSVLGLGVETCCEEEDEFPRQVNAVNDDQGEWMLVYGTLDSGAAESVMPENLLEQFPIKPGKSGERYVAANGSKMPNRGERLVTFLTDENQRRSARFQITDVNKILIAMKKVTKMGHKVILEEDGGWMVHKKTGQRTRILVKDGVYVVKMWIRKPAGFRGQADN